MPLGRAVVSAYKYRAELEPGADRSGAGHLSVRYLLRSSRGRKCR